MCVCFVSNPGTKQRLLINPIIIEALIFQISFEQGFDIPVEKNESLTLSDDELMHLKQKIIKQLLTNGIPQLETLKMQYILQSQAQELESDLIAKMEAHKEELKQMVNDILQISPYNETNGIYFFCFVWLCFL